MEKAVRNNCGAATHVQYRPTPSAGRVVREGAVDQVRFRAALERRPTTVQQRRVSSKLASNDVSCAGAAEHRSALSARCRADSQCFVDLEQAVEIPRRRIRVHDRSAVLRSNVGMEITCLKIRATSHSVDGSSELRKIVEEIAVVSVGWLPTPCAGSIVMSLSEPSSTP